MRHCMAGIQKTGLGSVNLLAHVPVGSLTRWEKAGRIYLTRKDESLLLCGYLTFSNKYINTPSFNSTWLSSEHKKVTWFTFSFSIYHVAWEEKQSLFWCRWHLYDIIIDMCASVFVCVYHIYMSGDSAHSHEQLLTDQSRWNVIKH